MGQAEETVADIIALTPKPRGEGAWAWIRYHLIYLRSASRSGFICAQPGCSEIPEMIRYIGPTGPYCAYHSTPEQSQLRYARFLEECERQADSDLTSPVAPSRSL